jgi:hypothetical protein
VNPSLYRKKDRIEKGLPSFENAFKVRTDWFDKKRYDHNKEPSLNGICVHVTFYESNTGATGERAALVSPVIRQPKDCGCLSFNADGASRPFSRKS